MDLTQVLTQTTTTVLVQAGGTKLLEVAGQWLKDWRQEQAGKFFAEFQSMVNPLGLTKPREVPPKIWYPIIDHGTLEDDDFLRTKYAALLANAANTDFKHGVRPSFVEILKQLTTTEAKFIDELYRAVPLKPHAGFVGDANSAHVSGAVELTGLGKEEAILVLKALERHGLLDVTGDPQVFIQLDSPYNSVVRLHRFGYEFVAACQPPSKAG